mgnify:CR=1 FL=1
MKTDFFFQIDNRLHYGIGKSRELNTLMAAEGWKDIALLVDEGVAKHSAYYGEIKALIDGAANTVTEIQLRGSEEPSYDYLDDIAAQARALSNVDAVIAIGGGSALDIAKAVAGLITNPGPGISYRGFDQLTVPAVPSVCIPTTAGTGSEVTINAVFTDKSEMKKLGINGRYMNATYAVLDALWLESCPHAVAVSAGMDAMVHTLESFMTGNANPMTRAFNREAFVTLYKNLPALVNAPKDLDAKQAILMGAYLAAAGLFNSGSGISGALSYPLGVHYKVPHGIGGGIFIASVVEFNVAKGWFEYAELLDLIEPHTDWNAEQKSKRFAEVLRELSDTMGVPKTLCEWGVTKDNVEAVAELMVPLQGAFNQNPIEFSAETDALDMLRKHVA